MHSPMEITLDRNKQIRYLFVLYNCLLYSSLRLGFRNLAVGLLIDNGCLLLCFWRICLANALEFRF